MLTHVGDERSDSVDLELAAVMSAVAGALNAVGFQVAGLFSANMTGNVSALADHAARGDWAATLAFAGLVATFIGGAFLAAGLIYLGEARRLRSVYAWVVLLEAGLLVLMWASMGPGLRLHEHIGLITALSFVMGLQNAATTLISKARVRTTHVSGMATDIGIEMAAMFAGSAARRLSGPKLLLHCVTMLCFALGGVAGALIFGWAGKALFGIAALALAAVSIPSIARTLTAD